MKLYLKLFLLPAFLLLSNQVWSMSQVPSHQAEGQKAFDVSLAKTDGTTSAVVASNLGKKHILVFWATWCPHCRTELDNIYPNLASIEAKGIKISLINSGETKEEVNAYFERRGWNWVSFLDEENVMSEPYGVQGIPTLIFIDEQGSVRHQDHGIPDDIENYFK